MQLSGGQHGAQLSSAVPGSRAAVCRRQAAPRQPCRLALVRGKADASGAAQTLNELFLAFATYGTRAPEAQLDGAKFAKLFKDCQVLGKDLTTTDLDIIFSKARCGRTCMRMQHMTAQASSGLCGDSCLARVSAEAQVKTKGARKVTFPEFHTAMEAVAAKKVWAT